MIITYAWNNYNFFHYFYIEIIRVLLLKTPYIFLSLVYDKENHIF